MLGFGGGVFPSVGWFGSSRRAVGTGLFPTDAAVGFLVIAGGAVFAIAVAGCGAPWIADVTEELGA